LSLPEVLGNPFILDTCPYQIQTTIPALIGIAKSNFEVADVEALCSSALLASVSQGQDSSTKAILFLRILASLEIKFFNFGIVVVVVVIVVVVVVCSLSSVF
jgi:hypothetical protein